MIVLHTAQLIIKTKYYKNNNGTHTFQMRVPDRLRPILKKNNIVIKLTGKESSMVAEIAKLTKNTQLDFPDFSRHLIMSKMKRRGLYATHQIYGRI